MKSQNIRATFIKALTSGCQNEIKDKPSKKKKKEEKKTNRMSTLTLQEHDCFKIPINPDIKKNNNSHLLPVETAPFSKNASWAPCSTSKHK